jgi:hypothetical protein
VNKIKSLKYILIFSILLYILSFSPILAEAQIHSKLNENKVHYNILIDLVDSKLYLINVEKNLIVNTYTIAGGKPSTPSPIGTWYIVSKGKWSAGFGTRWMALNVPWGKYGIHGTNKPLSIGGSVSLGCIRMLNKDVEELYGKVGYGTPVVIYGGPYNMFINKFRCLQPGDTGSDVYEVQKRLKDRGYYLGALDGKYGEGMKEKVIKFRKDNHLNLSHAIDYEFYQALDMKPFE